MSDCEERKRGGDIMDDVALEPNSLPHKKSILPRHKWLIDICLFSLLPSGEAVRKRKMRLEERRKHLEDIFCSSWSVFVMIEVAHLFQKNHSSLWLSHSYLPLLSLFCVLCLFHPFTSLFFLLFFHRFSLSAHSGLLAPINVTLHHSP